MKKKILLPLSLISVFGILTMMNYTTPIKVGVVGVLVFFTMIFILFFSLMVVLIKIFQRILNNKNGELKRSSDNKTYMYATIAAFGPVMILIARPSVGFNVYTIGLITIFVFLGCFLVYKRA